MMRELAIVLAVGLGTYSMRALFFTIGSSWQLPSAVRRRLAGAKHAVLAALTVGFMSSSATDMTVAVPALAVAIAVALAARRRALAPLVAGLSVAFAIAAL